MTQKKPRFNSDKILKEEQTILNSYSGKKRGTLSTLFKLYSGNYKNLIIAAVMFLLITMTREIVIFIITVIAVVKIWVVKLSIASTSRITLD